MLFCTHVTAQCSAVIGDGDFEAQRNNVVSKPWVAEGQAGIDVHKNLSFRGSNNAWARNTKGWNAIRQRIRLSEGLTYTLRAYIRTSGNIHDGYFGFRDENQKPVSEIKFSSLTGYKELRVKFRPARTGYYNIFAGFWAPNQDAWIQVDYVQVDFPCDDVNLVPADQ